MIKAGKGGESELFIDLNGWKSIRFNRTAATYCSYIDPEGIASMPKSAETVTQQIPHFRILATV